MRLLLSFLAFLAGSLAVPALEACSGGEAMSTVQPITDASPPSDAARSGDAPHVSDAHDASVDARPDGPPWPDCSERPTGATARTIENIWTANPSTPAESWITGVYVTAISYGGCSPGYACQIFVQSDLSYPTLGAGAHRAIKIFVSAATAQ